MFINIEMDFDWTWGIDWHDDLKGIRLGCIAVHYFPVKFDKFLNYYAEDYHQKKIKEIMDNEQSNETATIRPAGMTMYDEAWKDQEDKYKKNERSR